jgi:hypothetical protein
MARMDVVSAMVLSDLLLAVLIRFVYAVETKKGQLIAAPR